MPTVLPRLHASACTSTVRTKRILNTRAFILLRTRPVPQRRSDRTTGATSPDQKCRGATQASFLREAADQRGAEARLEAAWLQLQQCALPASTAAPGILPSEQL